MKMKTKVLATTSLGRAPVTKVKCLSGLKEGKDYKVDLKEGTVSPLRDLGKESYDFEFDCTEFKMKTHEEISGEWKNKWKSAKTTENKLDVIAEYFGWK